MDKQVNSVKTNLWKNDLLPGITLASSTYSDHSYPPHFHDHYVIMIVNEGVNEGVCERRTYQVTGDDILFINPGEIHTGTSYRSKRLRYSALYVNAAFFATEPIFHRMLAKDPGLVNGIKELFQCVVSNASSFEIEEKKAKAFGELMTHTGSRQSDPSLSRVSVQKIKAFIEQRYSDQFTLASLASHADLSPYHLVRSFKQSVGITPFQFLRNFRIERAKHELLKKKSITDVALEVGFYDQSHFHKHFKLITGVTPREFQRH